jgi:hypothetical protein
VEAEVDNTDVVRRAYYDGDGREYARREPKFAAIQLLSCDGEETNCASCRLRNVAEQYVC